MQKIFIGSLALGWLLFGMSGHLVWSNKLLWLPAILFLVSGTGSLMFAIEDSERRGLWLLIGIGGIGSFLLYAAYYVLVIFGLV